MLIPEIGLKCFIFKVANGFPEVMEVAAMKISLNSTNLLTFFKDK